ncbi:PHF5-like protein-domain-containing protein [Thelephora terrestris]|uniref:PHF5-like protein-domain-containing protein n=1 Tax=Thelephora terrestris TaxID=56493 RepID=A0A9P6HM43_9AGAM|nr:PHF5-like protein-domain-containing protein [Thelephora terrestris]
MSKHNPDLIMCRRQPGIALGRLLLCEKHDRQCPICDSTVRPDTLVRICDECNFGTHGGRCVICDSPGISDAYYCAECTRMEKDRDGCPKIVNLGASRKDLSYERRKLGTSVCLEHHVRKLTFSTHQGSRRLDESMFSHPAYIVCRPCAKWRCFVMKDKACYLSRQPSL